ncbi:phosphoenolpyruvate--protein phosphotransferase [Paraferrimonas haliotis]|uniref:phosphoenolpyruvate--protein phosphotransferase n=1 Tax=Paraferrimonas haliotis TaxID=2013866 RepID=A0AA37TQL5_9GAMM|nr:phosphoenolpyruvate--protein phosphotransferase [Paraferrimonas haliotis]GLS82497.1 phosphoenolpyruvate--protein phosphotransferase [Paraferrimonas haliotis]
MLDSLRDITQTVVNATDLNSAMASLVVKTKRAMATQCCSVYIAQQQQLILSATDGLSPAAVGHASLAFGEGVVGLVAERAEPINLADAQQHPAFKRIESVKEDIFSAFLAAPIIHQGQLLGVLVVQQQQKREFDDNEEAFLVTLAAQLAMAISGLNHERQSHVAQTDSLITGESASPGIAIAPALLIDKPPQMDEPDKVSREPSFEKQRLSEAIGYCRSQFFNWSQRFDAEVDSEVAQIFSAYQSLLEPASLGNELLDEVALGWTAETAVRRVCNRVAKQFLSMQDPYLKERSSDVIDIGQRLLHQLQKRRRLQLNDGEAKIIIAKEASATLLAEIPQSSIAGIIIQGGGANSHVAILARAMKIPAVMGVEININDVDQGQQLIVNGFRGQVVLCPSVVLIDEYRRLIAQIEQRETQFTEEMAKPCCSFDGQRVGLFVNAGLSGALADVASPSVGGIGLYRSEIPFMLHSHFLTESEQLILYKKVMRSAKGKPVTMRTLDVGGDKPLAYFPIVESNPFLGWRGIRLTLDHPEMLLIQLRAMIKASVGNAALSILLPMVSNLKEIERSQGYIAQALQEIEQELGRPVVPPKIGIMLEIPAMIFQLPQISRLVDFISVGSNDLTQYLLAVDRSNPAVSELFDSYHPAVLTALAEIARISNSLNLEFSICGELAGEPLAVMLLVGMGYRQLSMNPGNLGRINYLIRRLNTQEMEQLLESALLCQSAYQVRGLCIEKLESLGLKSLLH